MATQYLFLFTLGPVQSFIAQARKTQDLYAGSKILSDLIGFAMDKLKTEAISCDFIFPEYSITSKPNRFVAIVESEDIQKLGDELKCSVEKAFYEGKDFGKLVNDIYDCKDQLKDFIKVYWVAKQFDENGDYPTQYKELEQLLGAVKNVRYFNQFAEKGRKCSINGEYNVKFYRKSKKETDDKIDVLGDKNKLFHKEARVFEYNDKGISLNGKWIDVKPKHLQQGEGLCAVSLLKRYYKETEIDSFSSTAEISTLDTLNILRTKGFASQINQLLDIDEQFIYEESITDRSIERVLENNGKKISKQYIQDLQKEIKDAADKNNLKLSKYYAILAFDADGMGIKLGKANSKEEHQKISKLLGNFATKAQEYIDNNNFGRTVYAGGDDFLGFLNLNHLFEAMQELRQIFDKEINEELDKSGYSHLKLTFSAGVAIAHYKTPLSEVLNWARAMEKEAKKIDGIVDYEKEDFKKKYPDFKPKNAYCIAVLKHSGEIHKTLWKWTYSIHDPSRGLEELWMTDLAKILTDYLKDKKVSDKFITNLSMEFENLINDKGVLPATHDPILDIELRRLAERARNKQQLKQQLSEKDLKVLMIKFYQIYVQFRDFQGLQNLLNLFHICEFVGRHLNKTILEFQNQEKDETVSNPIS